jgi:hypothetical protein
MVLLRARPHPAPLRPPARRKAARDEPHRTAAGKPDVHLAARGQVATRGDEPLTGEQAKRVVHRRGLDDAVQVEPRPALQHQHTPVQLDCPSAKGGPERRRARLQPGEVAVVPGRLERCAHGRVDEAAGLLARPQPRLDHPSEDRREEPRARTVVDRVQLAVRPETAEEGVPLLEERAHASDLVACRAFDDDLASHGREAVHVGAVATDGSACAGARIPACSWFSRTV